jgi:hypothetical protein
VKGTYSHEFSNKTLGILATQGAAKLPVVKLRMK